MDWVQDIIKEYVIKNQVQTTTEQIKKLQAYFIQQGYNSIGLVCDALIVDSKVINILSGNR